jgi:hypothetical protein
MVTDRPNVSTTTVYTNWVEESITDVIFVLSSPLAADFDCQLAQINGEMFITSLLFEIQQKHVLSN